MSQPLVTYLNDHLAGSAAALELLEHLADRHAGTDLGHFFRDLHREVDGDRHVLQNLLASVGGRESGLKHVAAWVTEKAARAKLAITGTARPELELFEALETLSLGVLGKRALWRALAVLANRTDRLAGHDFDALASRAEDQYARLESHRISVAPAALLSE